MLTVNILRSFDVLYENHTTNESQTYYDIQARSFRDAAKHVAFTRSLKLSPMLHATHQRSKAEEYRCGHHHRMVVREVQADLARAVDQRRGQR